MPKAKYYLCEGRRQELDEKARFELQQQAESMANQAMRVIVLAYAEYTSTDTELTQEHINGHLIIVGLCGLIDPPREEAKKAIAACHRGGIKVVMATGDNMLTARAVASWLGIKGNIFVTGNQLSNMADQDLESKVEDVSVFARIEPLHKLRIIEAFKKKGHVVAMTGDGVNDAPALEAADIGVAMGITGPDVAKESADMILADDNFKSIVTAVE